MALRLREKEAIIIIFTFLPKERKAHEKKPSASKPQLETAERTEERSLLYLAVVTPFSLRAA